MNNTTEKETVPEEPAHSLHLLKLAYQCAGAGTWDWDIINKQMNWSEELFQLFGLDANRDKASFEIWKRIIHPDDLKMAVSNVESALKEKEQLNSEYRVIHPDGKIHWICALGKTVYDASGEPLRMTGFCIDITSRKETEEALRVSEEKHRIMFTDSPDAYLIIKNGIFTDCNHAAEAMLQCSRAEIIGGSPDFFSPEYQPDGRKSSEAAKEKISVAIETGKITFDWVHCHADRSEFIVEASITVLILQGQPVLFVTWRNITERKRTEAALRESEEKFKTLADTSPFAIYMSSGLEQKAEYINPVFVEMFGYRLEDVPTVEKWWPLAYPDATYRQEIKEEWQRRIKHAIETHSEIEPLEAVVTCKDGSRKNIRWGFKAIGKQNWAFGQDITEHTRVERIKTFLAQTASGTKNESFFKTLAQYLANSLEMDFVCIDSLEGDGLNARTVAVWCDGHFEDNVTYALKDTPCGDVVGKTVCCFPAKVCQFFPLDQVLKDLRAESYAGITLFGHDGAPVGLIAVISRKPLANRQLVESTLKMVAERTASELERIEVEETLRNTNAYLENLLNYANAPIIVWDAQFRITRFNHAFEFLTGRKEAEVVGQSLEILFPPDTVEQSMTFIRKTGTGERWESVEIEIMHLDGSVRTVLWNSATLFATDGVTPVATIAQGQDITGRKEAESIIKLKNSELERINAEKDKFFSIIAHDLRSPFNNFLGLTEVMDERISTLTMNEIRKIARGMKKSADNLFQLLENLLQWARMQQGMIAFTPTLIKLLPLVNESAAPIIESADQKGIKTTCDIANDIEVFADSNMLQSIMRNLLSNAVKFTHAGGEIVISASAAGNDLIEIAIKDSGIGMSHDIIGKLFHIDARINRKGTGGEPSSGLGLLLCKEFIEKHGGTIRAESEDGKGSTFYFTIPGKAVPQQKLTGENIAPVTTIPSETRKLKILVVDDDDASLKLAAIISKKFGREILTATDGFDAVEICRKNPDIELILMDVKMPGMNGYEATGAIRQFNKEVIIIAQTAFTMGGEKKDALAAGCNDYIPKPVNVAVLSAMVKKYFAGA